MSSKYDGLEGRKFGRLTVIEAAEKIRGNARYRCVCICGKESTVGAGFLVEGRTTSCGCYNHEIVTKHGQWKSKVYAVWQSMMQRCYNVNDKNYWRYGGKGKLVSERWHDFQCFFSDMGHAMEGMTIERIDNDKGYSPENCKWATRKEQQRNRCANRMLSFNGETHCATEWGEIIGISSQNILHRMKVGYPIDKILSVNRLKSGRKKKHGDQKI